MTAIRLIRLSAPGSADARYHQDTEPGIREQVASALVNKGVRLGALGRFEEAIAVYDALDARYHQDTEPEPRPRPGAFSVATPGVCFRETLLL